MKVWSVRLLVEDLAAWKCLCDASDDDLVVGVIG